mmetsp:Transcript_5247/g.7367  ORF Transcript_5247/g.7367 Transcript_5247/m.7367 type:complete len:243 (-) Transcript_5247:1779-2507(-)
MQEYLAQDNLVTAYTALSVISLVVIYAKKSLHVFVKPLPIILLISLAIQDPHLKCPSNIGNDSRFRMYWSVVAGLVFGMIGDIFLTKEERKNWFLAGLVSFLIGHIFYVVAFLEGTNYINSLDPTVLYGIIAVTVLYGALIAVKVSKRNGDFLVPVIAYYTIIVCMLLAVLNFDAALWNDANEEKRKNLLPISTYGAVLFVISDSIICWNKFIIPIPFARFLVLSTYYAAQALIAVGSVIQM